MGIVEADSVPPPITLPRFLKPSKLPQSYGTHAPMPVHAVYDHKRPFGQAQVLWWPSRTHACDSIAVPRTVLLFIPGNPGLLDFYVPFLDAIHRETVCESTDSDSDSGPSSSVTIFAHAHLGLSSYVGIDGDGTFAFPETSCVTLPAQIQAHVEFLDEILVAYGPATRVLLVGHSIGAWFVQEVLKARASLRPRVGACMLFPTLCDIAKTPGGRMLWPLFRPPLPRTLAYLSLLVRHVPLFIHRLAQPSWPASQLQVLRSFLHAPAAIYASLTMAYDELETVRDLDTGFLREFAENLWFYYADEDDWVGDQRGVVLRALQGTAVESHVVHDHGGVPHAFCINHSAEVALQCLKWMRAGGLLGDARS